ncbi:S41 family peptidase [Sphingomonas sp. G-3-2-10]|uniref:S41 family peptidase n=1 Tax=Sphingomonas sp. G-3-2-10 TaxID=2728838 RepID=UPI00146E131C|nr:S41 family peptidase [Sphingomonas sp. G-3-2-10]NML07668.1 S41 family peptidase [Sphingomonas sp. G-3-2-10]
MNRFAWLIAAALAVAPSASAQNAPPQAAAPVQGRTVAEEARKVLAANYVVVDRRPALDKALADGIASGRYDNVGPGELAERINADLTAVAHDKHLNLRYDPPRAPPPGAGPAARGGPPDEAAFLAQARSLNHGIRDLRVLPGNVRVMNYTGFFWTGPESAEALDGAMKFLMGGDAAIIDLRGNGGGSPEAVQHLARYFVPPNTELVRFHMRSDPVTSSSTGAAAPALGMWPKDKPIYVLISGRSASAAEEFASHVARFKFAPLVGETTAGAAYRNELFRLPGGFALSVSVGRPEIPGVGDWEGKGVPPSIAVPVDLAQARALQEIYRAMGKAKPERSADYEWMAAAQGGLIAPAPLARAPEAYAGRYGVRTVSVEKGGLAFRRDGAMSVVLVPLGPDLFGLENEPLQRIRFPVEGGVATGIEVLNANGSVASYPKGPAR